MALLRPTPWTTQPQQTCEIDWSNPITRGLVSEINPAAGDGVKVGAVAKSPRRYGIAHIGNASSYITKPTPAFGSAATILHVGNLVQDASGINLFSAVGTSGAGNQVFAFQGSTSSASGRVLIRAVNAGGISSAEIDVAGISTSAPESIWVAVYNGTSSLNVFQNGRNCVSGRANTAASGAMSSMDNFTLGGVNRGTDAFAQTGQTAVLALAWNRALSAAEIKSISANPWQIFQPIPRRIFAPVATSSDHLIIGANSSQANTASDGAIGQTHLVTASASNQSNIASDASVSQSLIQLVTASDSTQTNTASQAAINQTHLVAVASSNQASQVSDAAIQQSHLVLSADSNQANTASPASITQALDKFVTAADSTQANTASTGSIQQTHLIQCAGVAIDNVASASSVVQEHLVGAANSAQGNTCSSASISSGASGSVTLNQETIESIAAAVWVHMSRTLTESSPSAESIAAAVLAAAQITPIHADARSNNGAPIIGDGSELDPWRGVGVLP